MTSSHILNLRCGRDPSPRTHETPSSLPPPDSYPMIARLRGLGLEASLRLGPHGKNISST